MIGGTGFNLSLMPKSLKCYICGRDYGTKSLEIHLKTCMKKWEVEESKKPKKDRRPLPQPPKNLSNMLGKGDLTYADLEKYNNQAFDEYNEVALMRCEFCNRTFNPDSLKIHQRVCTKEKPFKPLNRNAQQSSSNAPPSKNVNFGTGVGGNPSKTNTGGFGGGVSGAPLNKSTNFNAGSNLQVKSGNFGGKGMVSYNQPTEEHVDLDLEECYKCGRKFASDRLAKHEKVCKGDSVKVKEPPQEKPKPSKPKKPGEEPKWKKQHEDLIASMKYMKKLKKAQEAGISLKDLPPPPTTTYDDRIECPHCGRKFGEVQANRHIPACANTINKPKPPPSFNKPVNSSSILQKYDTPSTIKKPTGSTNNNFYSPGQNVGQKGPSKITQDSIFSSSTKGKQNQSNGFSGMQPGGYGKQPLGGMNLAGSSIGRSQGMDPRQNMRAPVETSKITKSDFGGDNRQRSRSGNKSTKIGANKGLPFGY